MVTVRVIEIDKVRNFLPDNLKNDIDSGEIYKQEYKNKPLLQKEIASLVTQGIVEFPLAEVSQEKFGQLLETSLDNWQTKEPKSSNLLQSQTIEISLNIEEYREYIENILKDPRNLSADANGTFKAKPEFKQYKSDIHIFHPDPLRDSMEMDFIGGARWNISSPKVRGKNAKTSANKYNINGNFKDNTGRNLWTKGPEKTPQDNAIAHYQRHGNEFPQYKNVNEYVKAANDFVRNPPAGTLTKVRTQRDPGDTVYYHPQTNTLVIKSKTGEVKTMFKPKQGQKYYERQK